MTNKAMINIWFLTVLMNIKSWCFELHVLQSKREIMVPRQRNARGFTDPLLPCAPSLRPPQRPDIRLPKIVTLHQVDAEAWSVLSVLHRTVCVVLALRRHRTIISPWATSWHGKWSSECTNNSLGSRILYPETNIYQHGESSSVGFHSGISVKHLRKAFPYIYIR